jgi:hypothetical protein
MNFISDQGRKNIRTKIETFKNRTNHKNSPKTKQKISLKYSGEMI